MLGTESTVFMPVDAALPKVAATRDYGARVAAPRVSVDEALVPPMRSPSAPAPC